MKQYERIMMVYDSCVEGIYFTFFLHKKKIKIQLVRF